MIYDFQKAYVNPNRCFLTLTAHPIFFPWQPHSDDSLNDRTTCHRWITGARLDTLCGDVRAALRLHWRTMHTCNLDGSDSFNTNGIICFTCQSHIILAKNTHNLFYKGQGDFQLVLSLEIFQNWLVVSLLCPLFSLQWSWQFGFDGDTFIK